MRNAQAWRPTKYVLRGGRLRATRDRRELGVASRLMGDAIARAYGQHLPVHARGRLVDLGCGKVPFHLAYRDRVDEVVCVDWPGSMHGRAHLDLQCDLSRALPLGDGRFDTALLSDVLEHVADPQALCLEVARVLAPGGRLLMNTPFFYWVHEEPHDYFRYTEFALRRLVERAGLRVLVLEPIGGRREVLADLVAKGLSPLPWIGEALAAAVQALAAGLPRRARPAGRVEHFPLGYFLVAEKPGPARS
jgi:SAM-dependent methyltransferase